MNAFELHHMTFAPTKTAILNDINLDIPWGIDLTIAGHSGSGKSTLLRLLATLLTPTSGTILYNGKPQSDYDPILYRREVSYCAQQPALFGATVADDLRFPFAIRNTEMPREQAEAALESVDLAKTMLDAPTQNLSGGERQRVALLRLLFFPPKVLLLDEVTTGLDPDTKAVIHDLLDRQNKKGITLVSVTHDEGELHMAKNLMTLVDGQFEEVPTA